MPFISTTRSSTFVMIPKYKVEFMLWSTDFYPLFKNYFLLFQISCVTKPKDKIANEPRYLACIICYRLT